MPSLLHFRGWQRAASEALIHAATDDDPKCVSAFVEQARDAAGNALDSATNPRQVAVVNAVLRACDQIANLAKHPERM